jgi:hypothetical protein
MKLPLLGYDMRATTRWKAFLLYASYAAAVAACTFFVHDWLTHTPASQNYSKHKAWRFKGIVFYIALTLITFLIVMSMLTMMFVLVGYGGGMLAIPSKLRSMDRDGHKSWVSKRLYGDAWCHAATSCRRKKEKRKKKS